MKRGLLLLIPVSSYGAVVALLAYRNPVYEVLYETANPAESVIIHSNPNWQATLQGAAGAALPVLVVLGVACVILLLARLGRAWWAVKGRRLGATLSMLPGAVVSCRDSVIRRRVLAVVLAVAIVGGAFYSVVSYNSFEAQYQQSHTIGADPIEEHFDLAKGQILKVRFIMGMLHQDAKVIVVIRQATQMSNGDWYSGYIAKDSPNVGDGDVVRFRPSSSGHYIMSVTSRSGGQVPVNMQWGTAD